MSAKKSILAPVSSTESFSSFHVMFEDKSVPSASIAIAVRDIVALITSSDRDYTL